MSSASHFLRYTPPDLAALERDIASTRDALARAERAGDAVLALDRAGELVAMLTSARCEADAVALGERFLPAARAMPDAEPAAWLLHGLATAHQYAGDRATAHRLFAEALARCRAHGWQVLEHFVQHHWGRSLVEQGSFDDAERCFEASLRIRRGLNDPRVDSSQRALDALAQLRASRAPAP